MAVIYCERESEIGIRKTITNNIESLPPFHQNNTYNRGPVKAALGAILNEKSANLTLGLHVIRQSHVLFPMVHVQLLIIYANELRGIEMYSRMNGSKLREQCSRRLGNYACLQTPDCNRMADSD